MEVKYLFLCRKIGKEEARIAIGRMKSQEKLTRRVSRVSLQIRFSLRVRYLASIQADDVTPIENRLRSNHVTKTFPDFVFFSFFFLNSMKNIHV